MGLFDKIRGEFIDVIQWLDDTQDTIVYRFERQGSEIKNGAKLTVRESQVAVLVDEGKIADVYQPGLHELITENMPILTTLRGWKYGFQSPFKVDVYFVSMKRFTDLKWGTANPVMMRDADFGVVRVRAFGSYAMRVADAVKFLKEIAGTDWQFTTDEVSNHIRNQIVTNFSQAVANAKIPVLDLAGRYSELGEQIRGGMASGMADIGVEILNFNVENVSVPPEVEAAIDKRSSMGVVGNLGQFMQFEAATAMEKAAENPGGMGAAGVGLGMGAVIGQIAQQAQQAPPPVPAPATYYIAVDGQQQGPYGMDALRTMVGTSLQQDSLVWSAGMAQWSRAGDVDALKTLFASIPPPLPPQ